MDTYVQCPYCLGFNTYRTPLFKKLNGDINVAVPENVKCFSGVNCAPRKWLPIVTNEEYNFLGYCENCQARFIVKEEQIVQIESEQPDVDKSSFSMTIEDVFSLNISSAAYPYTAIVTGKIASGCIQIGDKVILSSDSNDIELTVLGIEVYQRLFPCAEIGDNCGILLNVSKDKVHKGDVLKEK